MALEISKYEISDNLRWILTAAHCLTKYKKYALYMGSISTSLFDTRVVSGDIYIHPNANGGVNDVGKLQTHSTIIAMLIAFFILNNAFLSSQFTALIKLPQPVENNLFIRPATLPTNCGDRLDSLSVTAIGKGGNELDKVLRYAHFKLFPENICRKFLALDKGKNHKPNSIMCAHAYDKTIFTGDSGKLAVVCFWNACNLSRIFFVY